MPIQCYGERMRTTHEVVSMVAANEVQELFVKECEVLVAR
jgi:hypothetical protein